MITSIQKGDTPSLLLLSGMHGDEYGVISIVSEFVQTHSTVLPSYIYIPEVSPSAVKRKSRHNMYNHDINRCFTDPVKDIEAINMCEQISQLTGMISLDFHEDIAHTTDFYFYDTGELSRSDLDSFRENIRSVGLELYSGIDDPDDPALGCYVDNGYVSKGHEKDSHESGFLIKWLLKHSIISRAFTFEVPGKGTPNVKKALVNAIFSFFIDRNFMIQYQ